MTNWDDDNMQSSWFKNKKVKSIIIEDGVTTIGEYAFYGSGVTDIIIPDSVITIGEHAFSNCSSLQSVAISDKVTKIGYRAFFGCTVLTEIHVSENNQNYTSQDGILFNKDKSELILFPIGNSITEYTIPDSVTVIEENVFAFCKYLVSIAIPDGVTSIGENAFSYCYSLKSVTIPDSVTEIKKHAFYTCEALKSMTIPENVTIIGDSAFSYCRALPAIQVSEQNQNFFSQDGVLFHKDKSELLAYPNGNEATEYIIPDGVVKIGELAFSNCDALESVIIPDSVTKIENRAFFNSKALTSVTIENPDCEIIDNENGKSIPDTAVIHGYENSTAQAYAEKYNRKFVLLGETLQEPS